MGPRGPSGPRSRSRVPAAPDGQRQGAAQSRTAKKADYVSLLGRESVPGIQSLRLRLEPFGKITPPDADDFAVAPSPQRRAGRATITRRAMPVCFMGHLRMAGCYAGGWATSTGNETCATPFATGHPCVSPTGDGPTRTE